MTFDRDRNLDVVDRFFTGPRDLDRLSLMSDDCEWEVLGIPFDQWMQVGLFPIAYTTGTDFAVTPREPAANFLRWNDYRL